MPDVRNCTTCNLQHLPPLGRRCRGRVPSTKAEAPTPFQASNGFNISQEALNKTIEQVQSHLLTDDGSTPTVNASGNSSNQDSVNSVENVSDASGMPIGNILKTLNNIVGKFDMFEKQAKVDRDRVSRLCEQLQCDNVNVKKGKTPKKVVYSKKTDVCVNQPDLSVYRNTGARPRVPINRQQNITQEAELLTYD